VPQDEVARINSAGGKLDPSARGVNADEFARAVPLGVTKVNIDTDGRLVWTRVHREYFRDQPDGFDFRKPGDIYVQAYADFIVDKSHKLLSAGTLPAVTAALC
jgi:fructose-bisphosphate aldolase class II